MKTYLRYSLTETFGVIASTQSNVAYDHAGNLAVSAALQQVGVWNLRQGTLIRLLKPEGDDHLISRGEVSYIAISPNERNVIAGYTTGIIRVYDISNGSMTISFNGHKSAVTVCRFDKSGDRLISGGADTDLVVWDMVAERGDCRLRGHKDGITDATFLPISCILANGIASCSKDSLVKIWDLETQHCMQTIVGHRSEVWSLDISPCGTRLVTTASDAQLRVWCLEQAEENQVHSDEGVRLHDSKDGDMLVAIYMGSFLLSALEGGQANKVRFHQSGGVIAIQGGKKSHAVEVIRVRTKTEATKKRARRIRRHREKLEKKKNSAAEQRDGENKVDEESPEVKIEHSEGFIAGDELESFAVVRSTQKIRSFDLSPVSSGQNLSIRVLLALQNNSLEVWELKHNVELSRLPKKRKNKDRIEENIDDKPMVEVDRISELDGPGHRGDVRAVSISSDSQLLASVGKGEAKLWNARTRQCVRTTMIGFGLCCIFAPGDRHLVVGTKEGHVQIIDLASGDLLWDIAAHTGSVWSIDICPDGSGMATGSADGQVKLWEFEVVNGNLGVVHARTIKMADDVLCVRYSKGRGKGKGLIAVAVLDATVKVFHEDSLKFFLSLYGHKLPVMSMDISDDGSLLATGSADRTVKLWGLDFGDCHRSLLAHSDSIMGVRFLPRTHLLFTTSKDKMVKMWDADRFEKVLTLEGHQAEVWGLAVCKDGSFVFTGGHDRSLRIWERTDEMVFIEEEREKELEQMFDAELGHDDKIAAEARAEPVEGESAVAGRRGLDSILAGERLLEALELVIQHGEEARLEEKARRKAIKRGLPPPKKINEDPLLLGMAPDDRFLNELIRIRAADLEQALLVLPFSQLEPMAACLSRLLHRGLEVELCARCTVLLLRAHQASMAAGPATLALTLEKLRLHLRQRIQQARDAVGKNMAGMKLLKQKIDEHKNAYALEGEYDRLAKRMHESTQKTMQ